MPTEFQILERLRNLRDPEIGRSLGELNMLRGATVGPEGATVRVELPTPAYPKRERISGAVTAALAGVPDVGPVRVEFSAVVQGKNTGGSIGLTVKNVVAVGSGKGGVGKSTVAAALACGLKTLGCRVGLMDADVYGPSIPHLMGSKGQPLAKKITLPDGTEIERMIPVEVDGLKIMSVAYFVQPDQAVIWRGPLLHRAITQFLKDTEWGELDYLIIDLPPGTGDVSLTLSQLLGLAGAIVVCTPQQVALLDAVKAVSMYRQVKIPVLGMVENMTGEIFGRGGAKAKAAELGIPFLGEIPIEAGIRIRGDEGRIASLFADDNPSRPYLLNVCEQAAMQIAKSLLETPRMPTLEIL
ncbi:MAG TPA: Mrp/NBP35 family ATP-binding protein [Planctomycetaceae bacterium]|nr:Mrp/NBP35 family ATP-binding protein [Planctomycetaceae bacterium]